MAAVIECVGREAGGVEAGGDVPVAPGVLADAVGDDHDGPRLPGGQPGLPVDLSAAGTCEEPLRVLHVSRGAALGERSDRARGDGRIGEESLVHGRAPLMCARGSEW